MYLNQITVLRADLFWLLLSDDQMTRTTWLMPQKCIYFTYSL